MSREDAVAVEAPLEIRLRLRGETSPFSVTLRTPGHDEELALGLLFAEGVVRGRADVEAVASEDDVVAVTLAAHVQPPTQSRTLASTAACGACGKTSLADLEVRPAAPLPAVRPRLSPSLVHGLPARAREAQPSFAATGGVHGAALFSNDGRLLCAREDVGRHNAVDKVVGTRLRAGHTRNEDAILVLSGRAGFELVQKALMAGIPTIVAVGAPSTLAVELATKADLTLIGFARDGRFNVYAGSGHI